MSHKTMLENSKLFLGKRGSGKTWLMSCQLVEEDWQVVLDTHGDFPCKTFYTVIKSKEDMIKHLSKGKGKYLIDLSAFMQEGFNPHKLFNILCLTLTSLARHDNIHPIVFAIDELEYYLPSSTKMLKILVP